MQCERCQQPIDTPFYARDKATGGPVCGPCAGIAKVVLWAQWAKATNNLLSGGVLARCLIEGRQPTEAELDEVMNAASQNVSPATDWAHEHQPGGRSGR